MDKKYGLILIIMVIAVLAATSITACEYGEHCTCSDGSSGTHACQGTDPHWDGSNWVDGCGWNPSVDASCTSCDCGDDDDDSGSDGFDSAACQSECDKIHSGVNGGNVYASYSEGSNEFGIAGCQCKCDGTWSSDYSKCEGDDGISGDYCPRCTGNCRSTSGADYECTAENTCIEPNSNTAHWCECCCEDHCSEEQGCRAAGYCGGLQEGCPSASCSGNSCSFGSEGDCSLCGSGACELIGYICYPNAYKYASTGAYCGPEYGYTECPSGASEEDLWYSNCYKLDFYTQGKASRSVDVPDCAVGQADAVCGGCFDVKWTTVDNWRDDCGSTISDKGCIEGYKIDVESGNKLSGWLIRIRQGDVIVASQRTDANGYYRFDDLDLGTYTVEEVIEDNTWEVASGYSATYCVTVTAGTCTRQDFYNKKITNDKGCIEGYKIDSDTGDKLSGWLIRIRQGDVIVASQRTDANGYYRFDDLDLGTYTVEEVIEDNTWEVASGYSATYCVTVTAGTCTRQDFYNKKITTPKGCIEGYKRKDSPNYGTGLVGWEIHARKKDDHSQHFQTTTDENGYFKFYDLEPGEWIVWEVEQEGWEAHPDWRPTRTIIVEADDVCNEVIFLNRETEEEKGCISGYKTDESGAGLEGWTIKAQIRNAGAVLTTVTDANGYYTFDDLPLGTYDVWEVMQDGWEAVTSETQSILVTDNTVCSTANFVNKEIEEEKGCISGYKTDESGAGLEGWTIKIQKSGSSQVRSMTTGSDGHYRFDDLSLGTYDVWEEMQDGWEAVTAQRQTVIVSDSNSCSNADFTNRIITGCYCDEDCSVMEEDGNFCWEGEYYISPYHPDAPNYLCNENRRTDMTGWIPSRITYEYTDENSKERLYGICEDPITISTSDGELHYIEFSWDDWLDLECNEINSILVDLDYELMETDIISIDVKEGEGVWNNICEGSACGNQNIFDIKEYLSNNPQHVSLRMTAIKTGNCHIILNCVSIKAECNVCAAPSEESVCGDGRITGSEECEFPGVKNSASCAQDTQKCIGNKLSARDGYGDCSSYCGCDEDAWGEETCTIGKCGAECSVDSDCDDSDPDTMDSCSDDCGCVHEEILCHADEDCDDENGCTIDSCENSGTDDARCIYTIDEYNECCDEDGEPLPYESQPWDTEDTETRYCEEDILMHEVKDYFCDGSSNKEYRRHQEMVEDCNDKDGCYEISIDPVEYTDLCNGRTECRTTKIVYKDYSCNDDRCSHTYAMQDSDDDLVDDRCDNCLDPDHDGFCNEEDNCPSTANPLQRDQNHDGVGDVCDTDQDGDGYSVEEGDCDDYDEKVNPGMEEIAYNGKDDDCNPDTFDMDRDSPRKQTYADIQILNEENLQPGNDIEMLITVKNTGYSDLENVKLSVSLAEYGEFRKVKLWDIDEGETESSIIYLPLPEYAHSGYNYLRISISNDDFKRVIIREFILD